MSTLPITLLYPGIGHDVGTPFQVDFGSKRIHVVGIDHIPAIPCGYLGHDANTPKRLHAKLRNLMSSIGLKHRTNHLATVWTFSNPTKSKVLEYHHSTSFPQSPDDPYPHLNRKIDAVYISRIVAPNAAWLRSLARRPNGKISVFLGNGTHVGEDWDRIDAIRRTGITIVETFHDDSDAYGDIVGTTQCIDTAKDMHFGSIACCCDDDDVLAWKGEQKKVEK
ncbi:hypothetical protein DFJ74DRAFT_508601 [Hyaloraphidium curvatum]|nr:hypothetical protein DFJ74DRAFT_508601 [Hyaloraphidium curvatum]